MNVVPAFCEFVNLSKQRECDKKPIKSRDL